MKKLIIIVLAIITIQSTAQDFAPIGAIWHYTQGTINPGLTSFKTLESVSDTIIDEVSCRKIIEVERYLDTTKIFYRYMYSKNDSVFLYAAGGFQLLYDFGANTGDTIILDFFITHDDSPLKMIIDSTGTTMVNDVERKIQYFTCGDGIVVEFGNIVIEGIGNTNFMFPTSDFSFDGPLRCYEDIFTGLYLNPFYPNGGWNHEDCEQIITSVNENEPYQEIILFPNPASSNLMLKNIDVFSEFQIFNFAGRSIKNGGISPSQVLDISDLPGGTYLIELTNDKKIVRAKFIKK